MRIAELIFRLEDEHAVAAQSWTITLDVRRLGVQDLNRASQAHNGIATG
jgi:hypothetical protein